MKKGFIIFVFAFLILSCEKSIDSEILKFYGDAYESYGYSVAKSDDGYLIAGEYGKLTRADGRIVKQVKKLAVIETDLHGNEIRKDFSNNQLSGSGTRVITLSDGSFVVAGYVIDSVKNQKDICVVKFAEDGEGYTEKSFKIEGNQYANDIIKTQGGYLILGTTDVERGSSDDTGNARGKKDILLLSITDNLDLIRYIPYGFTGNDEGVALKADRMGGYVVAGTTDRYESSSGTDVFLLSVNEDISNVSATSGRFIDIPGYQSAADFEVTADGYFIAGNVLSDGKMKGYTWKVTGNIWGMVEHHDITFEEPFTINAISKYKTNSYLIAGQYGSATSGSMLIFATDMLGYPIEGKRRITGGTGSQAAFDVIADGDDIVTVGKNSYETSSMITLLKFRF